MLMMWYHINEEKYDKSFIKVERVLWAWKCSAHTKDGLIKLPPCCHRPCYAIIAETRCMYTCGRKRNAYITQQCTTVPWVALEPHHVHRPETSQGLPDFSLMTCMDGCTNLYAVVFVLAMDSISISKVHIIVYTHPVWTLHTPATN